MAIQFARARYISRSSGGSAVRSAAYNGRDAIMAERTGELFSFRHRDAPTHHEVLLPEGASGRFRESSALWNAAEEAERRCNSQVAREIVLALPADREVSDEDRVILARSFAEEQFICKGLAVQLDVHAPHEAGPDQEAERGNWHAHLLITTRRLEGDGFASRKARDLDPEVRQAGGRGRVTDGEAWGVLWRDHQERYFCEHGIDVRVDSIASHPGEHIGPVRMRRAGSESLARAAALRDANEQATRDPEQVLAALTRNNATFTERDVDRHLAKHLADEGDRANARAAVLGHSELVALHDRASGEAAERFTTRAVRRQEEQALADAADLAGASRPRAVAPDRVRAVSERFSLRGDQRAALEHAAQAGGLALIEGRAGTGKSHTLAAVRDAHEGEGRRVIGLAPTNTVAGDLRHDGFTEAGTVHAELFRLKNGRTQWDRRTVVVVDEAAMLDSKVTGELLAEAKASGAKLILAGDDRQLASIERGGLFTELRAQHGAAAITEVTRQRVEWQREAARDLAEGRFEAAVSAYEANGAISWGADKAEAQAALVDRWKADSASDPTASRFVFAYTNADVDALNAELRQARRARGELGGEDVALETRHGRASFAIGDRVQLTDTDKKAGLHNGAVGTITGLDARTGTVRAVLDAPAGHGGREVAWRAAEFSGFRHGYAGTIYKGQGKTLDHTYLLHTHHWRSAASYVALTRQRHSAQVFVGRDTARNARSLAWQMGREEVRAASVAWATRDEVALGREPRAVAPPMRQLNPERVGAAEARVSAHEPAHGWLISPRVSADGRDSLGRGLDAEAVRKAVMTDPHVAREREALGRALNMAYREPAEAQARLDGLLAREGWTSTAARLQADPKQLGALRGRAGLLAGSAAKQERADAASAAGATPSILERIGGAEAKTEQRYRNAVEAQIERDAVGVPRLSPQAETALEPVRDVIAARMAGADAQSYWARMAGKGSDAVAEAWRAARKDPAIARELDRFEAAAAKRGLEPKKGASERSKKLGALARDLGTIREGQAAERAQSVQHAQAERRSLQRDRGPGLGR